MGRTRRQNRKEPVRSYINCLPTELLLAIFIQFWALDYGSHHVFLRVCRGWRAVTQSTRIFWTKILCQKEFGSQTMPSYITCSTPGALSKHLARIDGMKFELCFNWYHLDQNLDWAAVLRIHIHMCYQISSLGGDSRPLISGIWIATRPNMMLKELLMEYSGAPSSMEACLHTIVYRNGRLMDLYDLTAIWNQLQVLSLRRTQLPRTEKTQSFFSSLRNLRELSLDDIGDVTWSPRLSNWYIRTPDLTMDIGSQFLIKLNMHEVSLGWFHDRNYHNLVELSYSPTRNLYSPIHEFTAYRGKALTLPRLRRLHAMRDWEIVTYIHAPNIEAIELTQGYSRRYAKFLSTITTKDLPLQALYLHLYQNSDQETFIHVLSWLSVSTLAYLRLEQDRELSVDVMQIMLKYVRNGLEVRWNGAVVSGELEQLATWVETGHLVVEN
jgi:hypothetical protein